MPSNIDVHDRRFRQIPRIPFKLRRDLLRILLRKFHEMSCSTNVNILPAKPLESIYSDTSNARHYGFLVSFFPLSLLAKCDLN